MRRSIHRQQQSRLVLSILADGTKGVGQRHRQQNRGEGTALGDEAVH
jgi:hypothetical protein